MRTIIWLIKAIVYFIIIYPKQKKFEKLKAENNLSADDKKFIDESVRNWADDMLKNAGVTYEITGRENIPADRAVLFTPNHQSNFDIMLILSSLGSVSLVSKIELAKLPFVAGWMKLIDCVFLDRGNARAAIKSFAEAEKVIKSGKSVVIFPEGHRSKGGPLLEFKEGAFKIAQKAKVPVVPVVINGSYKAMEEHGIWIHPCHVKIKVLPAIDLETLESEDKKHIGSMVQKLIENEYEK